MTPRYSIFQIARNAFTGHAIAALPGVEIPFPQQANAVFARIPPQVEMAVREKGWFYPFIGSGGCRFMCAWDTQEETVDHLAGDLAEACRGA